MQIETVKDFRAFDELLPDPPGYGCLLRGVSDTDYPLLPSVGRLLPLYQQHGATKDDLLRDERIAFREFSEDGAALIPPGATTPLERLMVARHFGLRTRLLDWSFSPLVAMFFAVSGSRRRDGAVYLLYDSATLPNVDSDSTVDVFSLTDVHTVMPRHTDSRIARQSGAFTIHGDPTEPFIAPHMIKYVIPAAVKGEIHRRLRWYGINDAALFPDLEGIARKINSTAFFGIFEDG